MKARKEFDEFNRAQEAIRIWYQANPDKEPPAWMLKQLEQIEKAYREAKERE